MGVASLLLTFPPSWNGNSGPTPHFNTLTQIPILSGQDLRLVVLLLAMIGISKLETLHLNLIIHTYLIWNPDLIWTISLYNPTIMTKFIKLSVTCNLEIKNNSSDILVKISVNSYRGRRLTGVQNRTMDWLWLFCVTWWNSFLLYNSGNNW